MRHLVNNVRIEMWVLLCGHMIGDMLVLQCMVHVVHRLRRAAILNTDKCYVFIRVCGTHVVRSFRPVAVLNTDTC